jgi:hypothetical protein
MTNNLWKHYLHLLKITPQETMTFFQHKYTRHMKRLIKMKKSTINIDLLTTRMNKQMFENDQEEFETIREKFIEFAKKDNARGL